MIKIKKALQINGKLFIGLTTKPTTPWRGINNTTNLKYFRGKKPLETERLSLLLAVWTGLEPATPCVTGTYSNQLNYQTSA